MCATRQNDVRSWQNDVRAISDGTDVLGKMVCALMCALVCALLCAPMAGVPVAQRISFSSDHLSKVYEVLQPFLWKRGQQLALRFHVPFAMARDRGREMLLPYNKHKKKVSGTLHLVQETWRPRKPKVPDTFFCGRPQMPNGPWPGEKTPYFTAKTGHMARHGIWPSDAWVRIPPASRIRIRGTELPKSQAPTLSGVNDRGQGRTRNQEHSCNETRRR